MSEVQEGDKQVVQVLHLDPKMPIQDFVSMYEHLNSDESLPEVAIPVSDGVPQMVLNDAGDIVVEPVEE